MSVAYERALHSLGPETGYLRGTPASVVGFTESVGADVLAKSWVVAHWTAWVRSGNHVEGRGSHDPTSGLGRPWKWDRSI